MRARLTPRNRLLGASLTLLSCLALPTCGDDDGTARGDCGPSACGACVTGCRNDDRCEAGGWVCRCVCDDSGPSDTGPSDTGPSDTGPAPGDAGVCSAESEADSFVAANQACAADGDCVEVSAACYAHTQACCVVYLSASHDAARWAMLTDALADCAGGDCGCCASIPPPPACVAGTCGPRR